MVPDAERGSFFPNYVGSSGLAMVPEGEKIVVSVDQTVVTQQMCGEVETSANKRL